MNYSGIMFFFVFIPMLVALGLYLCYLTDIAELDDEYNELMFEKQKGEKHAGENYCERKVCW